MSLKEAKRHAADEALLHTDYIIPEVKEKHKITELTPTVELNNVATKLGMKVTYLSQDELEAEVSCVHPSYSTKLFQFIYYRD